LGYQKSSSGLEYLSTRGSPWEKGEIQEIRYGPASKEESQVEALEVLGKDEGIIVLIFSERGRDLENLCQRKKKTSRKKNTREKESDQEEGLGGER